MSQMLQIYTRFYNDPMRFGYQREGSRRFKMKEEDKKSNDNLSLDIVLEEFEHFSNLTEIGKGNIGRIEQITSDVEERYVMHYPVQFWSKDKQVSGKVDFGITIKHQLMEGGEIKDIRLSYLEESIVTDFKCES